MALICGLNESVTTNDKLISIDDWLSFYWESDLKLNLLKNAITKMVLKKVQSPHWALTAVEESLLVALKLVLMDEEEASGFKQPDFIGIPEYNRGFRHKPTNYHYSLQNLNSHRFRG